MLCVPELGLRTSIWPVLRESHSVTAWSGRYTPANTVNATHCTKLPMHGNETSYPIWIKFCRLVGITDIITYANFSDDRLRVCGWRRIKFCRSPVHSLSLSSLYNTTALLCECVLPSTRTKDDNRKFHQILRQIATHRHAYTVIPIHERRYRKSKASVSHWLFLYTVMEAHRVSPSEKRTTANTTEQHIKPVYHVKSLYWQNSFAVRDGLNSMSRLLSDFQFCTLYRPTWIVVCLLCWK